MNTGDEADGVHAVSISLTEQGKNDKKRKRAAKWSQKESIALLKSLRDLVQKTKRREQCVKGLAKWEHIGEKLVTSGYQRREAKSVAERWDTLRQAYLRVEKHWKAGEKFDQALAKSRKESKFLPAEYTKEWHTLAAGCDPKEMRKQRNSGMESAMVENTVAKQKIIDALPCDSSPASLSSATLIEAFHKHIKSIESLLSHSRDPASPSQRRDETDEPGDIVRSFRSIVEAVETNAKSHKSGSQNQQILPFQT